MLDITTVSMIIQMVQTGLELSKEVSKFQKALSDKAQLERFYEQLNGKMINLIEESWRKKKQQNLSPDEKIDFTKLRNAVQGSPRLSNTKLTDTLTQLPDELKFFVTDNVDYQHKRAFEELLNEKTPIANNFKEVLGNWQTHEKGGLRRARTQILDKMNRLDRLDFYMDNSEKRVVIVRGNPGSGRSEIVSQYISDPRKVSWFERNEPFPSPITLLVRFPCKERAQIVKDFSEQLEAGMQEQELQGLPPIDDKPIERIKMIMQKVQKGLVVFDDLDLAAENGKNPLVPIIEELVTTDTLRVKVLATVHRCPAFTQKLNPDWLIEIDVPAAFNLADTFNLLKSEDRAKELGLYEAADKQTEAIKNFFKQDERRSPAMLMKLVTLLRKRQEEKAVDNQWLAFLKDQSAQEAFFNEPSKEVYEKLSGVTQHIMRMLAFFNTPLTLNEIKYLCSKEQVDDIDQVLTENVFSSIQADQTKRYGLDKNYQDFVKSKLESEEKKAWYTRAADYYESEARKLWTELQNTYDNFRLKHAWATTCGLWLKYLQGDDSWEVFARSEKRWELIKRNEEIRTYYVHQYDCGSIDSDNELCRIMLEATREWGSQYSGWAHNFAVWSFGKYDLKKAAEFSKQGANFAKMDFALARAQDDQKRMSYDKEVQGHCLHRLGQVLQEQGVLSEQKPAEDYFTEAKKQYNKAITLRRRLGTAGSTISQLGEVFELEGNLVEALRHQAKALGQIGGNKTREDSYRLQIGERSARILYKLQEYDDSITLSNQVLKLAQDSGNKLHEVRSAINILIAYALSRKQLSSDMDGLEASKTICKENTGIWQSNEAAAANLALALYNVASGMSDKYTNAAVNYFNQAPKFPYVYQYYLSGEILALSQTSPMTSDIIKKIRQTPAGEKIPDSDKKNFSNDQKCIMQSFAKQTSRSR